MQGRPSVAARHHMVVSGHPWASQAGFQILEAGGNAIDAGVAVGLAINVLESEMTCFAGVAPSLLRLANGEVLTFVGVGCWPRAASAAYFRERFGGQVPEGILNTVVPAAPDVWLSALERFGTMSFAEVGAAAIRFARDGFPMYPFMRDVLASHRDEFAGWSNTAAIFLPEGELPVVGKSFVQADLARTLTYLADEERAASSRGREAGLKAARRAFYHGDIAAAIVAQQRERGGLLEREDLARYAVQIEPPVQARFGEHQLYGCGPWSQGPMVLLALQILGAYDLASFGHNSPTYIHHVAEALKLAAADREHYFGDPRQVQVPLAHLLAPEYAAERRACLHAQACPEMPAPGSVPGLRPSPWMPDPSSGQASGIAAAGLETSYFCVIDSEGNLFSSTPSDPTISGDVVPGTGITPSQWGSRAHTAADHPARVEPGWRPRMSANPMLAIGPDGDLLPIGSPGSEVLGQAQLQVFLNQVVFGMNPQQAVEVPRFASYSWPASAIPHTYLPGQLNLEACIEAETGDALAARGHRIQWWPERTYRAGSVGTIHRDAKTGYLHAGADPRRAAYAVGW